MSVQGARRRETGGQVRMAQLPDMLGRSQVAQPVPAEKRDVRR